MLGAAVNRFMHRGLQLRFHIACILKLTLIMVGQSITIREVKVKVKCTLVQALRLCTGRTAHRGE